jgi:hypothetical protein
MTAEETREFLEMCMPELTVLNVIVGPKSPVSADSSCTGLKDPDETFVEFYATFEKFEGKKRVRFWVSNNEGKLLDLDQIKSIQTVPSHEIAEIARICEFVIGNDLQPFQKKVVGEIIEFLNKIRKLTKK